MFIYFALLQKFRKKSNEKNKQSSGREGKWMRHKEGLRRITTDLPPELSNRVWTFAQSEERSASSVLRQAIKEYLQKRGAL